MHKFVLSTILLVLLSALDGTASRAADPPTVRTLDGSDNNVAHPTWGQAGTQYARVTASNYGDGIRTMVAGTSPRNISNRIFNDVSQNLFSENDISQWGWAWGQFVDHDIGLRDETPAEDAGMPFDKLDKLETFSHNAGSLGFSRVVGAEIQYITYNEFLPTLGVRLDAYRGYSSSVNPTLSYEFATVGYRAHSMIHGEFEPTVPAGTFTDDQLDNVFPGQGITVERNEDNTVTLVIPLVLAFGNPDLLEEIVEGPILQSLGNERQYKNDEQIANSLELIKLNTGATAAANVFKTD